MANEHDIAWALSVLHECFPTRPITADTGKVWLEIFRTEDSAPFRAAVSQCVKQVGRVYFPTPGEILAHMQPEPEEQVSATEVLKAIEGMGSYRDGWIWPRVEEVRAALGHAVAAAYGSVGPHRLNSSHAITRDIAERDFAETLANERHADASRPEQRRLLGPYDRRALGQGESEEPAP